MNQFTVVLRELKKWLTSFGIVRQLLPHTLYLLFGGLGILFLWELLLQIVSYRSYHTIDVLFNDIPLYALGYFAFFAGIWLALIGKEIVYLPYALWGYAFVILFPFEGLTLLHFVRALIYVAAGWLLFRYVAMGQGKGAAKTPFSG